MYAHSIRLWAKPVGGQRTESGCSPSSWEHTFSQHEYNNVDFVLCLLQCHRILPFRDAPLCIFLLEAPPVTATILYDDNQRATIIQYALVA